MITTLREYRTLYPASTSIPTLTQNYMLGILFARQRRKAAARARWQARWVAVQSALGIV